MKKKVYLIALVVCITSAACVQAQQLGQRSQFYLNRFAYNPAVAGSESSIPIMLNVRQQWIGIDDAPSSQTFMSHAYTGKGMGVGVVIYNDVAGPARNTGFNLSAARHFKVKGVDRGESTWLSVGMGALLYNYFIDAEELTTDPDEVRNDPAIDRLLAENSRLSADISFGVYLGNDTWFLGISAVNLIQTEQDIFTEAFNRNNLRRTYFAVAGYKHPLNTQFALEPAVFVKGTENGVFQGDVLLKGYFHQHYLGIGYRSDDAMVAMLGMTLKDFFQFAYSYDLTTSDLSDYNNGTHEVTVVMNLVAPISRDGRNNKKQERRKRPPNNNRRRSR